MDKLSPKGKKTKARILETARELFHKYGVNATSIDHILEVSGTGKSQFYHYFESKDDIIHQVLVFYLETDKSGRGHMNFNIKTWKDLEELFHGYVRALKMVDCERMCPVFSIGAELASENEAVRKDVENYVEFVRGNITDFLSQLQKEGKFRKNVDPHTLAYYCLASVHGAALLGKIKKNSDAAKVAIDHALSYLNSLKI